MDKCSRWWFISCLAMGLVFTRCAQTVPLTGGPEDKDPPKLIRSEPDTFQTNFHSTKIKLEFDEFVELDNVLKNLLITPVLRYQPTVVTSGKKVLVRQLDDSLWENTTYVMDFGEALQDITENNIAKGFRYVFSTGDYVDSLQIFGVIRDAFGLEPVADAFALAYPMDEDSLPYKETPRYVGRSDKNGLYRIRNMKAGNYKLFFCTDDNRNYLYDLPSEMVDFYDEMIEVSADTIGKFPGYLFDEIEQEQYLKGYGEGDPGSFYLVYNLPFDSLYFGESKTDRSWMEHFQAEVSEERDSVVYWLADTLYKQDSLFFILHADTMPDDTIEIVLDRKVKYAKVVPTNNLSGGILELDDSLELNFRFPISLFDSGKVMLMKDSLPVPIAWQWNTPKRKLKISADWKENEAYVLILDSAAFTDVHSKSNDSMTVGFNLRKATFYGTLELKLGEGSPEKGILQILDPKGNVVDEVYLRHHTGHYFPYLHPGEYRLKFLSDGNGNEKWDSGNYLERRHAEEVYIYQSPITIRSNWDQVIEWNFK